MAPVTCLVLALAVLSAAESLPLWTLDLDRADVDLQPEAAYRACKVFLGLGGQHVNIPSDSTTWQLRAIAEAMQNHRSERPESPELFISAEMMLPDMGYDTGVRALRRMLLLLDISHFDLVLVGAGDSTCGEVCVSGTLAAAEHMVLWTGRGAVGVSGWSLSQLQKMTGLLRKPPEAVKLQMDFMAASHLPMVKYCLAKNISFIAHWQTPGRISGMVLLPNTTTEEVTFAAMIIGVDWLHSKSVSIAVPHNLEPEAMMVVMEASERDLSDMETRAGPMERHFWPQWRQASHYRLYGSVDSCPAGLEIDSAQECDKAVKDLSLNEVSPQSWTGCFFSGRCEAHEGPACGKAVFDHVEKMAGCAESKTICQKDFAAEVPDQGSTLFLAMCMGAHYFDRYCAPFFLSFVRTYGAKWSKWPPSPSWPSWKLRIWVMAVEREQLRKAHRLLRLTKGHHTGVHAANHVDFEEGDFTELKQQWSQEHSDNVAQYLDESADAGNAISNRRTGCGQPVYHNETLETHCDPGVHEERMLLNNAHFFTWVIQQVKLPENAAFQYFVTVDSDTLFCKTLERYLPFAQHKEAEDGEHVSEWDYAFTLYDKGHKVPWGSNEEVAKTKNGHVRLNAGVQLFRNTKVLVPFLMHYVDAIHFVLKAGEVGAEGSTHENPVRDLLTEFRGPNQAAIAMLVGTSNLLYEDCAVCWPHVLVLETNPALRTATGSVTIKVSGLPMRHLNEPESLEHGQIPDDLHMLHLKGLWWRVLVMEGMAHATETRCYEWNFEAYEYWLTMMRIWLPDYYVHLTMISDSTKCNPDTTEVRPRRRHPLV